MTQRSVRTIPFNAAHMISPPETKTLKTLAATLSGAWIIQDPQWIIQSADQKQWLDETAFGFRCDPNPFTGLKLFVAPSFTRVSKERKGAQGWPGFIDLLWVKCSQGLIVPSEREADFIIVGDENKYKNDHPGGKKIIDWFKFMSLIPAAATF